MRFTLLSLILASSLAAAVANMGGTWMLDQKRSRFADDMRPGQVTLTIEHDDPQLKYSGTTNNPTEGAINDFSYDGAVDGKEHVVKQDKGDRRVTFKRINGRTVESLSKGPEGEVRSRITMSREGHSMERRMTVKAPDGKTRRWVEVYTKKK